VYIFSDIFIFFLPSTCLPVLALFLALPVTELHYNSERLVPIKIVVPSSIKKTFYLQYIGQSETTDLYIGKKHEQIC
jgi:hypothetical protein